MAEREKWVYADIAVQIRRLLEAPKNTPEWLQAAERLDRTLAHFAALPPKETVQ